MPNSTFIKAAINEQKSLNLSWYRNIECLLKIDEIYHLDHVSAYRMTRCENILKNEHQHKPYNHKLKCSLLDLPKIKPIPSRKFRINEIMTRLIVGVKLNQILPN